jgi:hypothetical protein
MENPQMLSVVRSSLFEMLKCSIMAAGHGLINVVNARRNA